MDRAAGTRPRLAPGPLAAHTGFADIRRETVVRSVRFPSVAAYVGVQFAATPLAALLAGRDRQPASVLWRSSVPMSARRLRSTLMRAGWRFRRRCMSPLARA